MPITSVICIIWRTASSIVAVPLFAVLYDLVKKLVVRGLKKKDQMELWQEYRVNYPDDDPIPSPKVPQEPEEPQE